MKSRIFIALLVLGLGRLGYSNNPDSIRIEKLESEIAELKERNQDNSVKIIIISFIGLAVLGGLAKWFISSGMKNIETRFRNRLEEDFLEVINERKDLVDRTFADVDYQQRLLETKKIGMWGETDDRIIKRIFKRMGIRMENLIDLNVDDEDTPIYDVLFINNTNEKLTMEEVVEKVKAMPSTAAAFYYNTTRKFFPIHQIAAEDQDRVNFATNPAQLYGNLVNTLAYQDKLLPSKAGHQQDGEA